MVLMLMVAMIGDKDSVDNDDGNCPNSLCRHAQIKMISSTIYCLNTNNYWSLAEGQINSPKILLKPVLI